MSNFALKANLKSKFRLQNLGFLEMMAKSTYLGLDGEGSMGKHSSSAELGESENNERRNITVMNIGLMIM